jgi:hypothetical protein
MPHGTTAGASKSVGKFTPVPARGILPQLNEGLIPSTIPSWASDMSLINSSVASVAASASEIATPGRKNIDAAPTLHNKDRRPRTLFLEIRLRIEY